MLEGISDFFMVLLDLVLFRNSATKKRKIQLRSTIDSWAHRVSLQNTIEPPDGVNYRFHIIDDGGTNYIIKLKVLKWGRIAVNAESNFQGQTNKNWSKKCTKSNLIKTLFETYGIVEQWIANSGSNRIS